MMRERAAIVIGDARVVVLREEWRRGRWCVVQRERVATEVVVLPRCGADVAALASSLAAEVGGRFPEGLRTRLIIPSSWCFVREIDLRPQKWTDNAAQFAFEEYLPVDLEELHCAARPLGSGRGVVAGVFTAAMRELVARLEAAGIEIESITPDVEGLFGDAADRPAMLRDRGRVVIRQGMSGKDSGPIRNALVAPAGEELGPLGFGLTGAVGADAEGLVLDVSRDEVNAVDDSSGGGVELESAAAVDRLVGLLAGRSEVLDFRTGALAHSGRHARLARRMQSALVAAICLLVVWGVDLRIRATEFRSAAGELRSKMGEVFAEVFPGASAVPGAALRMRSERIKLEGLTGPGAANAAAPENLVAFELLHAITAGIPAAMKLNLSEVIIDEDGIRLAGQTTSHEAAGELVRSLNEAAGVQADPPRTKLRPDKTVDFRIAARKAVGDAPQ